AMLLLLLLKWKEQTVLSNGVAPYGIVSLEMGSYGQDTAIVNSWKEPVMGTTPQDFCALQPAAINPLRIARKDVMLDYLFILLYTALLVIVLRSLGCGKVLPI